MLLSMVNILHGISRQRASFAGDDAERGVVGRRMRRLNPLRSQHGLEVCHPHLKGGDLSAVLRQLFSHLRHHLFGRADQNVSRLSFRSVCCRPVLSPPEELSDECRPSSPTDHEE